MIKKHTSGTRLINLMRNGDTKVIFWECWQPWQIKISSNGLQNYKSQNHTELCTLYICLPSAHVVERSKCIFVLDKIAVKQNKQYQRTCHKKEYVTTHCLVSPDMTIISLTIATNFLIRFLVRIKRFKGHVIVLVSRTLILTNNVIQFNI